MYNRRRGCPSSPVGSPDLDPVVYVHMQMHIYVCGKCEDERPCVLQCVLTHCNTPQHTLQHTLQHTCEDERLRPSLYFSI
jgi:hypothetical protein